MECFYPLLLLDISLSTDGIRNILVLTSNCLFLLSPYNSYDVKSSREERDSIRAQKRYGSSFYACQSVIIILCLVEHMHSAV